MTKTDPLDVIWMAPVMEVQEVGAPGTEPVQPEFLDEVEEDGGVDSEDGEGFDKTDD